MINEIRTIFERRQRLNLFFSVPKIRNNLYENFYNEKSESTLKNLFNVAIFFKNNLSSTKLVISGDWGYCYTNQLELICELIKVNAFSDISNNQPFNVNKAEVNRPRNTIALKESNFSLRSYFKDLNLSDHEKECIANFLLSQSGLRLSPALNRWCRNIADYKLHGFYIQRHFFIDHSTTDILTMLSLINPSLIRKTLDIIEINS